MGATSRGPAVGFFAGPFCPLRTPLSLSLGKCRELGVYRLCAQPPRAGVPLICPCAPGTAPPGSRVCNSSNLSCSAVCSPRFVQYRTRVTTTTFQYGTTEATCKITCSLPGDVRPSSTSQGVIVKSYCEHTMVPPTACSWKRAFFFPFDGEATSSSCGPSREWQVHARGRPARADRFNASTNAGMQQIEHHPRRSHPRPPRHGRQA